MRTLFVAILVVHLFVSVHTSRTYVMYFRPKTSLTSLALLYSSDKSTWIFNFRFQGKR